MRLPIHCLAAALALIQATFVNGWAMRLERNLEDENDMLNREWYNLKAHGGVKRCSAAASADGFPVSGFSITNFGPLDDGFREKEAAPKKWRDRLGWMGFWKNGQCQGLPTVIVHFYNVPYTRQAIYFPKLLNFSEDIDEGDISFARYGDIPFGNIWFHGNRQIPEGAVAVRKSPSQRAGKPEYEDEFVIFKNAVRVLNVGPNNDRSLVDPSDRRWDLSGTVSKKVDPSKPDSDPTAWTPDVTTRYIQIHDGANISANEESDRTVQEFLGLVPTNEGRGQLLRPPTKYLTLMWGGAEGDEDEDRPSEDQRAEEEEEPRTIAGTSKRPELEEELALQQAAYRSFDSQNRGPSGPGSTQPPSSLQNTGTMETEPLDPHNAGAAQAESEQYTEPQISDYKKIKSRLETKEMLSTLLEKYPNWTELTGEERRQRYNEFQSEKKQKDIQMVRNLIEDTSKWQQLSPEERYRLYRQLDTTANRARNTMPNEQNQTHRSQQELERERERLKKEASRREAEKQKRQEEREKRLKEEEVANEKSVVEFISTLAQERARYESSEEEDSPEPQRNAGSNNPRPPGYLYAGIYSSDIPPPQSNIAGNMNQNNARSLSSGGSYTSNNPPNSGGNMGQGNRPPFNPTESVNRNSSPFLPNPGSNTSQYNSRPPNYGGSYTSNNPPNFGENMGQGNRPPFNPTGDVNRNGSPLLPNSGSNTGQYNPRPPNYGGSYTSNNPPNFGGNMGQGNRPPFNPTEGVNRNSSPFLPNPGSNTRQYNYNPYLPNNGGNMGQNYQNPSNAGRNLNPNSSPFLPQPGSNVVQNNPRPLNTNANLGQNNQRQLNPSSNINQNNLQSQQNPSGNMGQSNPRPQNMGGNINPNPQNPGGNTNMNNAQPQPNAGGNANQNPRPPRRWEYGSQGPGPGVDYFTSNNVNTGMNEPPFYQDYARMGFARPYDLPHSNTGGPPNTQLDGGPSSRVLTAVNMILNDDYSRVAPSQEIAPSSSNNALNKGNTMEEEVEEEEEQNNLQVGNNGPEWGSNSLWESRDDDTENNPGDEFSAYNFGPRRLR
ncbi:hypothetical protein AOL_s00079g358 [Orbilia oligospora ATCC 24927]|uniref:Uncharacterized protein n=1 Tax=Arthrobotrys oligospora (strain ATCC 24927 / CBS 115.81 / DSM 1491) TaxID=756982 RepID=G1XDH3_ARTOA|nr:hypothetical protein AOL_s00079g358 [Orbilia oligospora ATCC 24927]EGX48719.1 hypothetical protein AOL_s00079g358 [Orbilia oligospora ATCC 24927]